MVDREQFIILNNFKTSMYVIFNITTISSCAGEPLFQIRSDYVYLIVSFQLSLAVDFIFHIILF